MRAAYTGYQALTFGDYMNLSTGRTLVAEPGGEYDIMPASGRNVDDIPAPWFVAVPPAEERALKSAPEPEPESGPEPATVDETQEGGLSRSVDRTSTPRPASGSASRAS
jgi:hypothetical protein